MMGKFYIKDFYLSTIWPISHSYPIIPSIPATMLTVPSVSPRNAGHVGLWPAGKYTDNAIVRKRRYIRPSWNLRVVRGNVDFQYCSSKTRESNRGVKYDGVALSNNRGSRLKILCRLTPLLDEFSMGIEVSSDEWLFTALLAIFGPRVVPFSSLLQLFAVVSDILSWGSSFIRMRDEFEGGGGE